MMGYVEVSTLLVGVVILAVAVLALRNVKRSLRLAEDRQDYLLEEQKRMEFMREEHKGLQEELKRLQEELEHKRQETQTLNEALKQEQQERLQAQQRAEHAEQEALRTATLRLRKQMDTYLNDLEGTGELGIRRVK
jgi:Skp family chaperone for outer membrane proteins